MATLPTLFLDADTLVVDKPVGLASIPEGDLTAPCALHEAQQNVPGRLWIVHRLDKEVSGVLLFARSAAAHRHYCQCFEHRLVEKIYLGLAHGRIEADTGTIDFPLRVFGSGRTGVDVAAGKSARTDFRVLQRWATATLVEVGLHTGRKHQIRAHFHALGHSLLGDPRYGDRAAASAWPRLFLHARSLALTTPGGAPLSVSSPLPEAFASAQAALAQA